MGNIKKNYLFIKIVFNAWGQKTMKNFKKISYLIIFVIFISTSGCTKKEKHISRPVFNIETSQFYQEIEGLSVTARKLNLNKANLLTSKKILAKYQPIELRIENKTISTFTFSSKDLTIKTVPIKNVIKRIRTNLLQSFLFPIASINSEKYYANFAISALATPFVLFGPGIQIANFSLPIVYFWSLPAAGMLGVALTGRDNQKKATMIRENASDFNSEIEIKPHSTFQTIFFVEHADLKPEIELAIQNKEIKTYLNFKMQLAVINPYVVYEN